MTDKPMTFVLISGAWHGGWCWERVKPLLEARGHRVVAPDLAGFGADTTPPAQVTLAVWADQVAGILRAEPEPAILVGHSRGGIVISEVAERVPDRIRKLVYLTALLIPDGQSISQFITRNRPPGETPPDTMIFHPDGTSTVRADAVNARFYNSTAPEWQARAAELLRPEPMAAFATPLQLTGERFGRVPRAYIEALRDVAIPVERQRLMHAGLPCDPVLSLDTDHSPFYSAPEDLAAAFEQIAATA